jgi:hypothetical protein
MDSGHTIKPVGASAPARTDRKSFGTSVATEPEAAQRVTAAAAGAPTRYDLSREALVQRQSGGETMIDPQTREALYRVVLEGSRNRPQAPREVARKLGAYARTAMTDDPPEDHALERTV